jgi:hypothetical protein
LTEGVCPYTSPRVKQNNHEINKITYKLQKILPIPRDMHVNPSFYKIFHHTYKELPPRDSAPSIDPQEKKIHEQITPKIQCSELPK